MSTVVDRVGSANESRGETAERRLSRRRGRMINQRLFSAFLVIPLLAKTDCPFSRSDIAK